MIASILSKQGPPRRSYVDQFFVWAHRNTPKPQRGQVFGDLDRPNQLMIGRGKGVGIQDINNWLEFVGDIEQITLRTHRPLEQSGGIENRESLDTISLPVLIDFLERHGIHNGNASTRKQDVGTGSVWRCHDASWA